ncbi:hypothetical protein ACFY5H_06180 [Streptomyces sp. NPDC013012]|uniref:hypothetical protein n=1 Tax=Streptomyces sp. NPDC013012 TaxID=3364860 RepID=UPI0036924F89
MGEEPPGGAEPLLRTVMRGGLRTDPPATPAAARERFERDLAALPEGARRIERPVPPVPASSTRLTALATLVRHRIGTRTGT